MPYQMGIPFARGSHTSYKAAETEGRNPQRGVKVMRLLLAYREAGDRGLTDHEATIATGLPVQSVCSLRNALREDGLVARAGERQGAYAHKVSVWVYRAPEGL